MAFLVLFRRNFDIKEIREFLIYGVGDTENCNLTYEQRLTKECEQILNRIHSLYPDNKDLDNTMDDLYQALTEYEDVYMEIEMKAEARLLFQLLYGDNSIVLEKQYSNKI